MPDARVQAITLWLRQFNEVAGAKLTLASADASFRRYFRASKDAKSWIVMDAPPEKENSEPFVRIARYLEQMNLNAPRIVEADLTQGFLLLTDLGSTQYLVALTEDAQSVDRLYADAIAALVRMQGEGASFQSDLPPYDEKLLRVEMSLFSDWLCKTHLGLIFSDDEQQQWSSVCEVLVRNALNQPCVFVHRDFHSRNLMQVNDFNPGILDFQDAVCGPYTYDLVSLLKDCYISWPPDQVTEWALLFYRQRQSALGPEIDQELFLRHFHLMGVQRQLKAAGIFARLNHRDGKPGYMLDIPLTLNYIVAIANRYEELSFLSALLSERVLPRLAEASQ